MLAVIKNNKLYFPEFMVNIHNQGVKVSRTKYFRNFIFVAFNDAGKLPVIHNIFKNFRSPVINNRRMLVGINIDPIGSINTVRVEASLKKSDSPGERTDIVSRPFYNPVDIPVEPDEWNIVADYPAMHDYCAALLHLGFEPQRAISKTLAAMGHPNGNKVCLLDINAATKKLSDTYDKNDDEIEQDFLFDLIKPLIKSMQ